MIGVVAADDDLLGLVHTPDYIEAVRRSSTSVQPDVAHGLGTMDDPVFAGMHEAGALVAGGTPAAARAGHEGRHQPGGPSAGGRRHPAGWRPSPGCRHHKPATRAR